MGEETFSSFAKTFATLQKLTRIEGSINSFVSSSRVPHSETRKFLRCETPEQASNTPLFQFLDRSFENIGLGNIEIINIEQFKHTYVVNPNPISDLYPEVKGKKTCYVISDAFAQFYNKGLGLVNVSEEMECLNSGGKHCVFEISLQPLSVYQIVLDLVDRKVVDLLVRDKFGDMTALADELLLDSEDMEYRLEILKKYHLISDTNELTKIGLTYSKYGTGPLAEKEEDFPPPWEDLSNISASVASASSFAEAFTETTESTPIFEVDESEIINLAEEAKKSKSFAELLSTHIRKESDRDEGGD